MAMSGTSDEGSARLFRMATGLAVGAAAGLMAGVLNLTALASYWTGQVPLTLAASACGALLWGTRLRRLVASAALCLGALWLAVAFTPLCAWLASDLVRRDPPRPADAVFILSSSLQLDGEPTPASLSRLLHGLELLGEGLAPRLVLSELRPPSASYAAFARATMARLRLERELVSVGPVGSTRDEAVAVGELCRQRGWRRLLIVTSPVHSRRACAALEREGVEVVSSPSVETQYDLETLALPNDRLQAFGAVLHERAGLWLYARRGWLSASAGR